MQRNSGESRGDHNKEAVVPLETTKRNLIFLL